MNDFVTSMVKHRNSNAATAATSNQQKNQQPG